MIKGLVRHSDVEVLSADGWLAVRRFLTRWFTGATRECVAVLATSP